MAKLTVKRLDPYKNFKFRVKFDADYVAQQGEWAHADDEMVKHREGSDPSSSLGPSMMPSHWSAASRA